MSETQPMSLADVGRMAAMIRTEVAKAVIGQEETIDHMLIALMARGHVLLEGPPGTAKTFLAQSFAATLGLDFGRIQFTPDLMPGDILGSNLFNFQTSQFTLTRGPIFWMRSTGPRPRLRLPCSKRCRNGASRWMARSIRFRITSWLWPPRTRLKIRASIHSPKRS